MKEKEEKVILEDARERLLSEPRIVKTEGKHVASLTFTRQTELLLQGIGAKDVVIDKCKARNISSYALHRLTEGDFIRLGATKEDASSLVATLKFSKQNYSMPRFSHKLFDTIEILKAGENQLDSIRNFMAYYRLRLKNEGANIFIEPDKATSASQILCIATNATFAEINEAELKLKELEATVISSKDDQKHSPVLYYILIGSVCIAACKLLTLWKF